MSERENLEVQRRARRIKERSERSTDTTIGIAEPRLFDGDQNLNQSARTGFLVGQAGESLVPPPAVPAASKSFFLEYLINRTRFVIPPTSAGAGARR